MYRDRIYLRLCLFTEFQRGSSSTDARRNICAFLGPEALSERITKYWFNRFQQGDFNIKDRPRSGRPPIMENQRLQELTEADPTRTVRSLASELEVSHTTVERHLNHLGFNHCSGRWVRTSNIQQISTSAGLNENEIAASSQTFQAPFDTPFSPIQSPN